MALIVQKFGGTSVGTIDRIARVAELIIAQKNKGDSVVVVVSAMAGVTDYLVNTVFQIAKPKTSDQLQEYDSILSTGEQISSALLALTLKSLGYKSRSWLGWQLPISTDNVHSQGKIHSIKTDKLLETMHEGEIPIVAGFQGIYDEKIITLGRGGSDTTAVALAYALRADRCDIYTDVNGIYTADPKIVSRAKQLKQLSYEEMLEMAASGAKVLHSRCVEIAAQYNLKTRVLSSFEDNEGTMIVNENEILERSEVTGITSIGDLASLTIKGILDVPGAAMAVFDQLKKANVVVHLIVQNIGSRNRTALTFTVSKSDIDKTLDCLKQIDKFSYSDIIVDDNVAKVSIVGIGIKSHSGIAQKMFQILAQKGINILVISTSEIKITVLIHAEYRELAVRALHTGYNLD